MGESVGSPVSEEDESDCVVEEEVEGVSDCVVGTLPGSKTSETNGGRKRGRSAGRREKGVKKKE